jgi:hypothetical protein
MRNSYILLGLVGLVLGSAEVSLGWTPDITVNATGDPAVDVASIQNAVSSYDNVLLRGTFDFGVSNSTDYWGNWGPGTKVLINRGVTLKGETVNGNQTTILHGRRTFIIDVGTPASEVIVEGIHFKDFNSMALHVKRVAAGNKVTLVNNKLTTSLWEHVVENGDDIANHATMWLHNHWMSTPVFIGDETLWYRDIKGQVVVKNNYINTEAGALPSVPTQTPPKAGHWSGWGWAAYPVLMIATDVGSQVTIEGNTCRNPTRKGIATFETYGSLGVLGNLVELGPLTVNPLESDGYYTVWALGSEHMGWWPGMGGPVRFEGNTVRHLAGYQIPYTIGLHARGPHTNLSIVSNEFYLEDCFFALSLGEPGPGYVANNRVSGSCFYGIYDPWAPTMRLGRGLKGAVYLANNFTSFDATEATVVFWENATDNSVVGGTGTAVDLPETENTQYLVGPRSGLILMPWGWYYVDQSQFQLVTYDFGDAGFLDQMPLRFERAKYPLLGYEDCVIIRLQDIDSWGEVPGNYDFSQLLVATPSGVIRNGCLVPDPDYTGPLAKLPKNNIFSGDWRYLDGTKIKRPAPPLESR